MRLDFSLIGRIARAIKRNGLLGFIGAAGCYVQQGLNQIHLVVVGYDEDSIQALPTRVIQLKTMEIFATDEKDVDELVRINEWKMPKPEILKKMEGGWHCYVGKRRERIVGAVWIFLGEELEDSYALRRKFNLAANEAYYYGAFTIPAFRSRGVIPVLETYVRTDIKSKYGRNRGLALVRVSNRTSLRTIYKMGWFPLGRAGFIQFLAIRFHYLWGRNAFRQTKGRFLVRTVE